MKLFSVIYTTTAPTGSPEACYTVQQIGVFDTYEKAYTKAKEHMAAEIEYAISWKQLSEEHASCRNDTTFTNFNCLHDIPLISAYEKKTLKEYLQFDTIEDYCELYKNIMKEEYDFFDEGDEEKYGIHIEIVESTLNE